jgi:hypothetical protein
MKSLRDATCAGFRDSAVFATLPKYVATGGLCGSLIQTLQGRIIAKTTGSGGSFEQEDSSSGHVNAGRVWTINFRDLHDKNHILVHSTICANGEGAGIASLSDRTQTTAQVLAAHQLVVRTFAFRRQPVLIGDWKGNGYNYSFDANGVVKGWSEASSLDDRGTYMVEGNRLLLTWTHRAYGRQKQACTYSLGSADLKLRCDGWSDPEVVLHRP